MCYMRFVCLLASTLTAAAVLMSVTQSPTLQRGVSVQMAVTNNAAPMPDADNHDAWIVTIADDGTVYFGIDPFTPSELAEKMKTIPRRRDQKLYIKADARAPFTVVEQVIEAGRTVFFDSPVLLTAQPGSTEPGTPIAPKGLEVEVGTPPAGAVATVVELFSSRQQPPILKINGDQISWPALQSTLMQHFRKGDEKVILLKADVRLSFADVAHTIDVCRSTGATIILAAPSI